MTLPLVDKLLLNGAVAVDTASPGVDVAGCASLTFYTSTNGPVSGGQVLIEEAHDKDYAGAWATLGSISSVGVTPIKLAGTAKAVRARLHQPITGGSVNVHMVAR